MTLLVVDMDNNYIYFAKNGVWQNSGVPTSGATGTGEFLYKQMNIFWCFCT